MRQISDNYSKKQKNSPLGRRPWLMAMVVAAMAMLVACGDPAVVGTVTSVTITPSTPTVAVGLTQQLNANVVTTGSASKAVTWRSSDTAIATVSDGGLVTGVAPGTATITATSRTDSTKSDSVTVTVVPANGGGGNGGDPTKPEFTFTADPNPVPTGEDSTLSWNITGEYTSAQITDAVGDVIASDLGATGSVPVSPTNTTVYTLTINYGTSSVVSRGVRVAVLGAVGAPTSSDLTAEVLPGSQVRLTWTGEGATGWSLQAVGPGGASEDLGSGPSNGDEVLTPIPSSATPSYRLTLSNDAGVTVEEIGRPDNVVISAADYDPYDAAGATPQTAIEGTLREVVANAEPGSVVGFASDITTIELPGVAKHRVGDNPPDAHLIIDKNLTISGPVGSPVTLQGASNRPDGHDSEELTWHSRVVYVATDVTAELENLVLTGGNFIYYGAGINNDGILTITNLHITGNRAFGTGGGIRNTATGTLTIIDSVIDDNQAYTLDSEIGIDWQIRGVPNTTNNLTATAEGNGGGIRNDSGGVVTIQTSQITNNHARFSGGGISNVGTMSLTDTQVNGNEADFTQYDPTPSEVSYGGGIMNGETTAGDGATLTMTSGTIDGNSSAEQGGGLWHARNATATLNNVNIGGNVVGFGGVNGYGGGIMHNFFTGEEDNLDWSTVTWVPDNTANRNGITEVSNREFTDRGVRPTGLGLQSVDPLDYRISPVPPR